MIAATRSDIETAFSELRSVSRDERHWLDFVELIHRHLGHASRGLCADGRSRLSSMALMIELSPWLDAIPRASRHQTFVRLSSAIEHVRNDLGWPLCAPPVPVELPQVPSAIRGRMPHDAALAHGWQDLRFGSRVPAITDDAEGVGELILSLVLDSGVVSQRLLRAVLRGIARGIQACGTLLWVNVIDSNPSTRYLEYRRVLLQPLTAILAVRFGPHAGLLMEAPRRSRDALNQRLLGAVRLRLTRLGSDPQSMPTAVRQLMAAANARLIMYLPVFLAAYARGHLRSTSLPDRAFLRLAGVNVRQTDRTQANADSPDDPPPRASTDSVNPFAVPLVDSLRACLTVSRRPGAVLAEMDRWIRARAPDVPPSAMALLDWTRSRLSTREPSQASGSTSRIVGDTLHIAPLVIGSLGTCDPCCVSVDELIVLRGEMTDIASDWPDPAGAARLLGRFVLYCARRSDPTVITLGQLAESKTPDANLLSFVEVRRLQDDLQSGRLYVRDPEMLGNLLTFLAACCLTLRSSEARGMLYDEITLTQSPGVDSAPPMLVLRVRRNALRTLKTAMSRRNVPDVIADPVIVEPLVLLVAQRAPRHGSDGIFGAAGFKRPSDDWSVGRPLQAAMQNITGDLQVRPYHLRHSAASRLLLALASRFIDLSPIKVLPFVREAAELSDRVGDLLINRSDLHRDLLWVVAHTMGHSSPRTTTQDYVHVMDLLLHAALTDRLPPPPVRILVKASGRPKPTAYRHLSDGVDGLLLAMERAHPGLIRRHAPADLSDGAARESRPTLFEALRDLYRRVTGLDPSDASIDDARNPEILRLLRGLQHLSTQRSGRRGALAARHGLRRRDRDGLFVPRELRTPESTSAAVALCDALESLPLVDLAVISDTLEAYVSGAHTTKPRIRFGTAQKAAAFVDALTHAQSATRFGVEARVLCEDPQVAQIQVSGAESERCSREAIRWVFQILAAIHIGA